MAGIDNGRPLTFAPLAPSAANLSFVTRARYWCLGCDSAGEAEGIAYVMPMVSEADAHAAATSHTVRISACSNGFHGMDYCDCGEPSVLAPVTVSLGDVMKVIHDAIVGYAAGQIAKAVTPAAKGGGTDG